MFPMVAVVFIGEFVEQYGMVSRSLEKMLLIAIGLTSAVVVGVPVLLHAMNTISQTSQLQQASLFADRVHNATARVDDGVSSILEFEIVVPAYTTVSVSNDTLTVFFDKGDGVLKEWSTQYSHQIVLSSPTSSGTFLLTVSLIENTIHLEFEPVN